MNIPFLGGPLSGQQHDVPTPFPAEVHTSKEQASRAADSLNPSAEMAPVPGVATYRLRMQREAGGTVRHVYVSDDYNPSPSLPIISRHFAAVCEQHGMRKGVHFLVYAEAT